MEQGSVLSKCVTTFPQLAMSNCIKICVEDTLIKLERA